MAVKALIEHLGKFESTQTVVVAIDGNMRFVQGVHQPMPGPFFACYSNADLEYGLFAAASLGELVVVSGTD